MTPAFDTPLVSVVMPVFNAQRFLDQAIGSILSQAWADFEFIIIDDGSTDASAQIISSYRDTRLRYYLNENNLGVVHSLNRGLTLARGRYLARMDADDISLPERLLRQVSFLEQNPAVGICGSWIKSVNDGAVRKLPVRHEDIAVHLLFNSAFAHPSVMLRRDFLTANSLCYRESYRHAEDYDLWARCALHFRLANIPEVLLLYRSHDAQVSTLHSRAQLEVAASIRRYQLEHMGVHLTKEEESIFCNIGAERLVEDLPMAATSALFFKILRANRDRRCLDQLRLRRALAERWLELCLQSRERGLSLVRSCCRFPLGMLASSRLRIKLALLARCLRIM